LAAKGIKKQPRLTLVVYLSQRVIHMHTE